jgi:hypothetical protein
LDFSKVIRAVAPFFVREGFAYAVIGAFGLHAYGLTRATSDLDFVTDVQAQAKPVSFLADPGYETLHLSSGYSNHLYSDPAMGRPDFVYVTKDTSRQVLGSAKRLLVLDEVSVSEGIF